MFGDEYTRCMIYVEIAQTGFVCFQYVSVAQR